MYQNIFRIFSWILNYHKIAYSFTYHFHFNIKLINSNLIDIFVFKQKEKRNRNKKKKREKILYVNICLSKRESSYFRKLRR